MLLSTPKVFRLGEAILGCVGDIRMLQLLRYSLIPPPCPETGDVERYVATDFTNAVRACFREGGYTRKKDERESGGSFLVGIRGHLFCLDEDYDVWETRYGYHALGSGDDVALGVLHALQPIEMAPEQRITLALEASAFHIASVRAPFLIESTGNALSKQAGER